MHQPLFKNIILKHEDYTFCFLEIHFVAQNDYSFVTE